MNQKKQAERMPPFPYKTLIAGVAFAMILFLAIAWPGFPGNLVPDIDVAEAPAAQVIRVENGIPIDTPITIGVLDGQLVWEEVE